MHSAEIGLFVPLADQAASFVRACIAGGGITLGYTLLRSITRGIDKPLITALGDLLFFFLLTLAEFVFLFSVQGRQMRWFILLGQAIGAMLCWILVAPAVFAVMRHIISALLKIIGYIFAPIIWMSRRICSTSGKLWNKFANNFKFIKIKLKSLLKFLVNRVYNKTRNSDEREE